MDIAKLSDNLFQTSALISLVLTMACLIMGCVLLAHAATAFKMHQGNPKMVPLDRPIVYLVLGITIASLPFWGYSSKDSLNPRDIKRHELQPKMLLDIDEPLEN